METPMILYMIAIIYRNTKASCVAISEWYEGISHDQFSKLLAETHSWPTLLWRVCAEKMIGRDGYIIIDDTVMEKFGQVMFGTYWVYSSRWGKAVLGINVVMLIWTDGRKRVPIGIKVWRKGGPSKIVLAGKLLRWAHRLEINPQYVVFDNWYSAKTILKQIRSYQWHYVTRLKQNRKFSGKQLMDHWHHRYGRREGELAGGIRVLVVKDGIRYLATSDLSLSSKQVKMLYAVRQQVEETFKILKDQLAWAKSPARTKTTQLAHLHLCLIAFCVLETEAIALNTTAYKIRRSLFRQAVPTYSLFFQPFMAAA
jgi:hypothetical protein